jgi:hypothetical protein
LTRRAAWLEYDGDLPVLHGTLIRLVVDHLPGDGDPKPLWLWSSRVDAPRARGGIPDQRRGRMTHYSPAPRARGWRCVRPSPCWCRSSWCPPAGVGKASRCTVNRRQRLDVGGSVDGRR